MRRSRLYLLFIVLLLVLAYLVGCDGLFLKSRWTQTQIAVDGKESEWSGTLSYFEKEKVAIGLQNDADNLYLLLKATDRNVESQIMRAGFTVWVDASGKKEKTLGIHYPIGIQGYGMPPARDTQPDEFKGELRRQFAEMLNDEEILGPEKNDRNRVPTMNDLGIEASLSDTLGVMIYELKIPLKSTEEFHYAVGAGPGATISLGFETGEFKRQQLRQNIRRPEGMPEQEGVRPPGERPFGRRPSERTGSGMRAEPIKFWTKATLAGAAFKN